MEFKPGDVVQAFFQDRWQTATVVDYGRKWTHVKFSHRARNTKLPIDKLREIKKVQPYKAPEKVPDSQQARTRYGNPEEINMDHFDMFFRIRDGTRPMATIVSYYKEEAMVMFEAVKKFRAMLTEPTPATPTEVKPLPLPMVNMVKPDANPKPPTPAPAPPKPAPVKPEPASAPVEQRKKRGRPSKKPKEVAF
jgi:hypothetical protein